MLFTPHDYQPLPNRPKPSQLSSDQQPTPPGPPVLETFQGSPQLSLFPRLGDFRPEDDEDRLAYWRTYREHLMKISGMVEADPVSGNRVFVYRGIKGIDSVGHFAPLAVEPNTHYKIGLKLKADLPDEATTGLGILEYKQFLWIGEQYPESLNNKIFLGSTELLRVNRTNDWQSFQFDFTTSAQTHMIHLVFFREGPASDRMPVLIDNISVMPE
ncbi:hypothetical protein [Malonomonas rubra]|uniref:hypothetical protein n=1 Tax=Malonomonas rubra TaxID=57040 RepID=UPI0026EA4AE7|nr:hypothetical protein [Malonomonas rubra]